MSIIVNLLPRQVSAQRAERRVVRATGAAMVVFVGSLGGLYTTKLTAISDAEAQRDTVQAEVTALETEVADLEPFRLLADELESRNDLLAAAMGDEVSHARVLNDLSLTIPATSSLRSLQISTTDPALVAAEGTAQGVEPPVASVTYQGYSTERFAPGVEAVLVDFGTIRSFVDTFVESAAVEEIGSTEVTAFTGTVDLDATALTHRYADGLPEEVTR